ncbi:50S ribosomal protein L6 [Candidatus Gottesmanbacteria bacterium RIFCSPLOWO2_01_FULL_49_10]|uniref:Large ribosomal subunit protein uL6 n=1 Tax=Candidatus Gottesmanbacteria bacterium RIFCSPLOWO2_01_FULL_49_10 TaxID=1798396 RepID=A0A1F6AXF2_9BACT|nr:MAG: 50S ribosomal protein L6 [Microgenomates group bacterium GW2011_GWA2_47_8]OGG29356.1 MAG: 50S ribosomal protein L6 [Candidatus Gottesmanbacteria bacterium RIFCSPLOWO2_01_FULL_49_10]
MSRIGNAPVKIPESVTVTREGNAVVIKGTKGELRIALPEGVAVNVDHEVVTVSRAHEDRPTRALHGLVRAEIANAIVGVKEGWTKTLELSGVGFRATMQGTHLVLTVGFSHPVTVIPPQGIAFAVTEGKIIVSGINKQEVGQVASKVREVKKPEPYKGKGIKYAGEYIRKKAGKSAKAVGGAPGAK